MDLLSKADSLLHGAKTKKVTTCGFISAFPSPMRRIIKNEGSHVIVVPGEGKDHRFVFDHVYGPTISEESTYQTILPPTIEAVFSGKSASILTLGGGASAAWILGKEHSPQNTSPSPTPKTPKSKQPNPSLVKTVVSNFLSRLAVPGTGFFGLSLSSFEIYNDQVLDLLSKKKLEPQHHHLPGLTSSTIRNLTDFEDALTLVLLNGKIRNGELRSHIFFRLTLLSANAPADTSSDLSSKSSLAKSSPKSGRKADSTGKGSKTPTKAESSTETSQSPTLDIVMLAPYNSSAKEFLSSEQNAIKRSLLNLSHLVDKMNGDVSSVGIHWRSFKLTQILQPAFTQQQHRLVITAHTYGHKTKLQESLWGFALLESVNRLNDATLSTSTSQPGSPAVKRRAENGHGPNGVVPEQSQTPPPLPQQIPQLPSQIPPQLPQHIPTQDHQLPSQIPPQLPQQIPTQDQQLLQQMNGGRVLNRHLSESNFSTSSAPTPTASANPALNKLKQLKNKRNLSVADLTPSLAPTPSSHPVPPTSITPPPVPSDLSQDSPAVTNPDMENSSLLMRDALSRSKTQNAQLLANHTQMVVQLEHKLRQEKEERVAAEEALQKQLKKEREKRDRLTKRLQNAEQLLDSKEKEVVKLNDIMDKLASESSAKLAALEKVVKARNESYRQKILEQESVIKRHNVAFKALQDRVSDLMEKKVLDLKSVKTGALTSSTAATSTLSQPPLTTQALAQTSSTPQLFGTIPSTSKKAPAGDKDRENSLVLGSADVLGVVSGIDVSRSEDEYVLLQKLQRLIAEQVQDLTSFNTKVEAYEQDKPLSAAAIDARVKEFENHVKSLREQVAVELKEYLDGVNDADIVAQLNSSIRQLSDTFRTRIVLNAPSGKGKKSEYSELVGEIEGEMEASEVLRVVGQQIRTTLEDQAVSFEAVLEDMARLTDIDDEELRLPITWEPMKHDLLEIHDRLQKTDPEADQAKGYSDLVSLHTWMQDQRLLFAHQRRLLDQICYKVIKIDGDDYEEEQIGEGTGESFPRSENDLEYTGEREGAAEGEYVSDDREFDEEGEEFDDDVRSDPDYNEDDAAGSDVAGDDVDDYEGDDTYSQGSGKD